LSPRYRSCAWRAVSSFFISLRLSIGRGLLWAGRFVSLLLLGPTFGKRDVSQMLSLHLLIAVLLPSFRTYLFPFFLAFIAALASPGSLLLAGGTVQRLRFFSSRRAGFSLSFVHSSGVGPYAAMVTAFPPPNLILFCTRCSLVYTVSTFVCWKTFKLSFFFRFTVSLCVGPSACGRCVPPLWAVTVLGKRPAAVPSLWSAAGNFFGVEHVFSPPPFGLRKRQCLLGFLWGGFLFFFFFFLFGGCLRH